MCPVFKHKKHFPLDIKNLLLARGSVITLHLEVLCSPLQYVQEKEFAEPATNAEAVNSLRLGRLESGLDLELELTVDLAKSSHISLDSISDWRKESS